MTTFEAKLIPNYPGYIITNTGEVWSNHRGTPRKLKLYVHGPKGYLQVRLYNEHRKTCLIHRLVAEYFLPTFKKSEDVHHKDFNPENNCIDNLQMTFRNGNHRRY